VKLKSAHTALNTGNPHTWLAGWVAETLGDIVREHKYIGTYERPIQSRENSIAKCQHACKIANV